MFAGKRQEGATISKDCFNHYALLAVARSRPLSIFGALPWGAHLTPEESVVGALSSASSFRKESNQHASRCPQAGSHRRPPATAHPRQHLTTATTTGHDPSHTNPPTDTHIKCLMTNRG